MIKLILAAVVGSSCLACGIIKSSEYKTRVNELTYFRDMLLALSREITYRKDPVALTLCRIKNQTMGHTLDFIAAVTSADIIELKQGWEHAADKVYGEILSDDDIAVVKEAGAELGRNGMLQQQAMIEMIITKLNIQIAEAEDTYKTKGKMCRAIGGFCGAAIVILLI